MSLAELEELFKQQSQFMRQQSELLTAAKPRLAILEGYRIYSQQLRKFIAKDERECSYDPYNGVTFDSWHKRYAWSEEEVKNVNGGAKVFASSDENKIERSEINGLRTSCVP